MKPFEELQVWLVTGSQHLYGPETLQQVETNAKTIAEALDRSERIPARVVFKPVLTTPERILELCLEANAAHNVIGLIAWMHTFSPAKMWIAGLQALRRPYCHLHTQFNRNIPWSSIDMDFMNLNQSAHGGREFGYMCSRLRQERKVVVGHWQDPEVEGDLATWIRAAAAWNDARGMKVARFGDNMREVAVTEGDKVEAQIRLGYSVHGYGTGDLAAKVCDVTDAEVDRLCAIYGDAYDLAPALRPGGDLRDALREAARIELGLRGFLEEGNFGAFTDTFENLHGLRQLPGLAVQRLMADGYGFGAEGDWKHAALVRTMKFMARGLEGGTSFMEDYTYDLEPTGGRVLGAHMLEICPSVAAAKPACEIHPLGIGGKEDPVRLVFDARAGDAVNASVVDMGDRFRMVVNTLEVIPPAEPLPRLPVARALWVPQPNLRTAAAAWILAGGAHHTAFSLALGVDHLEDFADIAGLELLLIDSATTLREFKKELRLNEAYHRFARGS